MHYLYLVRSILACLAIFTSFGLAYANDNTVGVYGGWQMPTPNSQVYGIDSSGNQFDFKASWEEKSFKPPLYYGIRYIHNIDKDNMVSIDFSHTKVYSTQDTLQDNSLNILEFTDGLNLLTVNYMREVKKPKWDLSLYGGVGVGISLPHVEFESKVDNKKTFEYQYGGPAVQVQAGIKKDINEKINLFSELKSNYSWVDASLQQDGKLKTKLWTNALNVGINYKF